MMRHQSIPIGHDMKQGDGYSLIPTTTDDDIDLSLKKKRTLKQKCKRCPKITINFLKPKVLMIIAIIMRMSALMDMITDLNLLYKASQSNYMFLTVSLFLSIIAPYLLQYSCGIKLFTQRRTLEKFTGFAVIFVALYLLPTGVLYFIFLDIFDICFTIYALFQLFCRCKTMAEITEMEALLARQLSMDRTIWEGLKRQKAVSQLMFETFPQVTIQGLLFFRYVAGYELANISKNALLWSVGTAVISAIIQIILLALESIAVKESFWQYSLTCFMARIGWIPHRDTIRKILENEEIDRMNYRLINYDIKYKIPLSQCIRTIYNRVEYDFSDHTISQMMATLMLRKEVDDDDYNDNTYKWNNKHPLEIRFYGSLRLLNIAQLVDLLRICSDRLIIIGGLNNPNNLDWKNALNNSRNLGEDTTTLRYSRDGSGKPHLMSIYLSEYRLKQFAKSVYKEPKQIGNIVISTRTTRKFEQVITFWVNKLVPNITDDFENIESAIIRQIQLFALPDTISLVLEVLAELFEKNKKTMMHEESQKRRSCKTKCFHDVFHRTDDSIPWKDIWTKIKVKEDTDASCCNSACCLQIVTSNYSVIDDDESEDEFQGYPQNFRKQEEFKQEPIDENKLFQIIKYLDNIGEIEFEDESTKNEIKGNIHENISIYKQCIKLDFDVNCTDISSGESLIFTLIRKNDVNNLRLLLFEYQIEKKIQINMDIHNFKGKSPLFYALRMYLRTGQKDLYLLLLKANADPNFPCIKRAKTAKSPLYFLLYYIYSKFNIFNTQKVKITDYWLMIKELISFDADLSTKESSKLPQLFIPFQIDKSFDFETWKNHYLMEIVSITKKLKLSFNSITDQNSNNPIHLLLQKYNQQNVCQSMGTYNDIINICKLFQIDKYCTSPIISDQRKYPVHDQNEINKSSNANKWKNYEQIKVIVIHKYLETLTKNAHELEHLDDLDQDERKQYIDKGKELYLTKFNKVYFENNTDIIEFQQTRSMQENEKNTIFIRIMTELQRIHCKWMLSTNSNEQIPIIAILREDGVAMDLIQKAYDTLNDVNRKNEEKEEQDITLKQKTFIDAVRNNVYARNIITKYIECHQKEEYGSECTDLFDVFNNDSVKCPLFQIYSYSEQNEKAMSKPKPRPKPEYLSAHNFIPEDAIERSIRITNDIINKGIETPVKNIKKWNKFEVVYSFFVESLSIADLVTDLIVLAQLIATDNQWWTALFISFLLAPYLVSFCSLGSMFQSSEKGIGNVASLLLITPLSIFLLIMVDFIFMIFVIINLIGLIFCCWNDEFVSYINQDTIFLRFGLSHMDIKGYRRLRTLSQLIFETMPQTLLQIRMIVALQEASGDNEIHKLDIGIGALAISIGIAFAHLSFEGIILWFESKATKATLFNYGITCLNARINWVPLLNVILRDDDNIPQSISNDKEKTKVNWEEMNYESCVEIYNLGYQFGEGSFRRLYMQITRLSRFTDGSDIETTPLVALLQTEYLGTLTTLKLGENSCEFIKLRDLSRLYRNSDNRVILDGTKIDWVNKVDDQYNNQKQNYLDESLFGDFMKHGEVDALHAVWNHRGREDIDILKLKTKQLLNDLTDIRTLKRFWQHGYLFGNSCDECHIIYDRIVKYYDAISRLQRHDEDETMSELIKYENMILLMLFFTRSTIINHKCPQCNISWKQYIVNKLKSEYGSSSSYNPYTIDITERLPKYVKIADIKIPFILAECSDILCAQIGKEIMKKNKKTEEPLFQTNKNNETAHDVQWIYFDKYGIAQSYDEDLMSSIREQYDKKYKEMQDKKRKYVQLQRQTDYKDKIITLKLNVGSFFKNNPKKYKIIIDYHHVPPKCHQVNVVNGYARIVKQLRDKTTLKIDVPMEENIFISNDAEHIEDCMFILASIIEYEPDAQQSYAIMKELYDLKHEICKSGNDEKEYQEDNEEEEEYEDEEEEEIITPEPQLFENSDDDNNKHEAALSLSIKSLGMPIQNICPQQSLLMIKDNVIQTIQWETIGDKNKDKELEEENKMEALEKENEALKKENKALKHQLYTNNEKKLEILPMKEFKSSSKWIKRYKQNQSLRNINSVPEKTTFDDVLIFGKKLKLRYGYDKLLMAIQRFYKKKEIVVIPQDEQKDFISVDVSKTKIDSDILGIKSLKIRANIFVNKIQKYNTIQYPEIFCDLWLKIAINERKKQIDSWNDILLKTIHIDLNNDIFINDYPQNIVREFEVNLSHNYSSIGSWNPSLYFEENEKQKMLDFEIKTNFKINDDYNGLDEYECKIEIKSAIIEIISNKEEDIQTIHEIDHKYWRENREYQWFWQDTNHEYRKYDHSANKQIERDYQKQIKEIKNNLDTLIIIPINDGVWTNRFENIHKHQIRIIASKNMWNQVNIENGEIKKVKRAVIDSDIKY